MTEPEDESRPTGDPDTAATTGTDAASRRDIVRQFVEHWGMMARAWGINATMGELFALLYVSGIDWTADQLREELRISRGNVSMNLRELIGWGVVHKVHRQGERREFYRAEADAWTLFRRIIAERKKRELDPTIRLLDATSFDPGAEPDAWPIRDRVESLRDFFEVVDTVATRLLACDRDDFERLRRLVSSSENRPEKKSENPIAPLFRPD